jgi:uncharacterized protein (TIGR03000 family)
MRKNGIAGFIGGTMVMLCLVGAPNAQAQRGNGRGSDPAPSGVSGEGGQAAYSNSQTRRGTASQQKAPAATPKTLPFLSPDNDLGYPLSNPPAPVVVRSYYAAGDAGLPPAPPTGAILFGIPAAVLPWNQRGFAGYNEPLVSPRDSALYAPQKYALQATALTLRAPVGNPESALLIARLPENALLWVEGQLTRLRGPVRYFQSPPLISGERYSYQVRAVWVENGRWVSQTLKVPVRAGKVEAVYLQQR